MELGEPERARAELEHILEKNPRLTTARIRLGVAFQRLRDTQRAIAEWQRALADDPEDMRPRAYLQSVGEPVDAKA